ncbi:MAG: ABC transporter permease, partial [Propionibacteriaceae bacterium]|nr:ABC transporter permease [Propionibacteriaceae bacterium]
MAQSNIRTVVSFEVVRTLRTKIFWIGSLMGPLLLAVVMAVSVLSNSSAADSMNDPKASFNFEWVDHSTWVDEVVATAAGGTKIDDPAQGLADVKDGKIEAFFEFPADPIKDPILISAADQGIIGSEAYASVASQVLRASAARTVDNTTAVILISGAINTSMTTYKDGEETSGIWGMIPPLVLIILFFFIVVMQGNRMLTATLEEKETRVTEMILTTIKPTSLLTGKVIALGIIGVVQVVAIIVPSLAVLLWLTNTDMLPAIDLSQLVFEPVPLILGTLMLLGGFLLFTCSLVAIGAAMPTVKDAQGMYATVLLVLIAPIYVFMWMLTHPENILVTIFTYFPWTAPMTAMARNAMGTLPWYEGVLVVVILFATAYLIFRIASRLF